MGRTDACGGCCRPVSSHTCWRCAATAAAVEPCQGSLDHPPLWEDDEPLGKIRTFDDLDLDLRQNGRHGVAELRSLIAAVSIQPEQERVETEQCREQHRTAVTILDVGSMNDGLQHQPCRVDKDMPLLAFDLLARIVTVRINRAPPFSALLTLWLSITAAVGLADLPAWSRHFT